jgi:hypothetical protein
MTPSVDVECFPFGEAVKAAVMVAEMARAVHVARQLGDVIAIDPADVDALYERYQNVYGQQLRDLSAVVAHPFGEAVERLTEWPLQVGQMIRLAVVMTRIRSVLHGGMPDVLEPAADQLLHIAERLRIS